jgi:NAD+ kinase
VYKPNVMSILTIKTWINGEFLNAYWADGLIVATPTGSTAYSLSCTGPIITPDSENFVITPIASHNLTVRPIIIRDDCEIKIRVEGKNSAFLVSLDSRFEKVDHSVELLIRKADFKINLLRLADKNFFQTIREKLNWGLDNRN